ncbi:MAG: hypothetical protein ABSD67_17175 [Terracidiphilus sp.]|jgi:hypothetical protein
MTKKTWAWIIGSCLALTLFMDSVMLWTLIVFHKKLPIAFYSADLALAYSTWQLYRNLRKRIYVGLKN